MTTMKERRQCFPLLSLLTFRVSQQEIFTISANFVGVFFQIIIEKEKKIHQDAGYLNEKMRLYSMNKN